MGYRDDAFYNLENIEPRVNIVNGVPVPVRDNAQFSYPPNTIRFLEAQSRLDNTEADRYRIQRGYIRGLAQPGLMDETNFTTMRCAFQFNPQTIQQVVRMDSSTYLPLLQDPYQFSQPMGKSTNFQFDLLFDRSAEVVAGQGGTVNLEDINYSGDVGTLGTLADLSLLYAIIGQGFSKELIEFQTKRLAQAAIVQYNQSNGSASTTTSVELGDASNAESLARTAVNANLGNAAFIIPAPVRVVFSSLFMVDGFVTGTTVDFLKFNTNMVPIQVRVGITMEAMYIGFAKKKTFLTDSLEKAGEVIRQRREEEQANQQELAGLLKKFMGFVSFGWSNSFNWWTIVKENSSADTPQTASYTLGDSAYVAAHELVTKNGMRKFGIGFDFANPSGMTGNFKAGSGLGPGDNTQGGTDSARKLLLDSGEATSLSLKWWFSVWGPYDTAKEAAALARRNTAPATKLVGNYYGDTTSEDDDFWAQIFPRDELKNETYGLSVPTYNPLTFKDKYFVWKIEIQVSATRQTATGPVTFNEKVVKFGSSKGDKKIYGTFPLSWGETNSDLTPISGPR